MSSPFRSDAGLVIVRAEIEGPIRREVVRLALDTGATGTVISAAVLESMGYDPASSTDRIRLVTASRVESAPRLTISNIRVLDSERTDFSLVAHDLPASAGVEGLLGLDFFRGSCLTIDFRNGQLTLA